MKKFVLITSALYLLPAVAFAQAFNLNPIKNLVRSVGDIVSMLVPILIALTLVVFFYGLFQYVRSSGEGHDQGRNIMIAGLLSLFVMVSVWGIVRLIGSALGVDQGGAPNLPAVPVPGGSGGSLNGSAGGGVGI
jgi:hypothetical protein